jgi:hypothetical protein
MSIISGKSMANLFVPPLIGVGLTVFKNTFFYGMPLESREMMVEIGSSAAAFVVTDIVGDMLLGLQQQDANGNFGKAIEAMLIEPPLYGALYSGSKEILLPNNFYKIGFFPGMFEGMFMYASTRFFAEPFVTAL